MKSAHSYNHNYFHVSVSEGPLSYRYRLQEAYIHYSLPHGEGSEHAIGGAHYPGEVSTVSTN